MEEFRTEPVLEPSNPEGERSGFLRFVFDLVETLLLAVVLFAGINILSARIRVDGYSMEPTLKSGEFVLVNKVAYKLGEPRRGDVIVFRFPGDPEQEYIKRVIGLSWDRVKVAGGQLYVNDQKIEEPYIANQPAYQNEWVVPEGSLFVLGDNRNNSSDSHIWGPVPLEYIIGKALLVYWPPEEWGLIGTSSAASAAH